jgi:hypothetical protein
MLQISMLQLVEAHAGLSIMALESYNVARTAKNPKVRSGGQQVNVMVVAKQLGPGSQPFEDFEWILIFVGIRCIAG